MKQRYVSIGLAIFFISFSALILWPRGPAVSESSLLVRAAEALQTKPVYNWYVCADLGVGSVPGVPGVWARFTLCHDSGWQVNAYCFQPPLPQPDLGTVCSRTSEDTYWCGNDVQMLREYEELETPPPPNTETPPSPPTETSTAAPPSTETATATSPPTLTSTPSETPTVTDTASPTPSDTPTPTESPAPSASPSPSATLTATSPGETPPAPPLAPTPTPTPTRPPPPGGRGNLEWVVLSASLLGFFALTAGVGLYGVLERKRNARP